MVSDEIIYCFKRGVGWEPQYKDVLDFIENCERDTARRIQEILMSADRLPYTDAPIRLIRNTIRQVTITGTVAV